jgi:tRNA pseudouridine32 synthase/23S rRNA pseudouridine746 synthase
MSNGKNREAAEKGCFNNWLHDMTGAEGGGQTGLSPRALAFVAARRVAAYVEQHPELTAGEVCGKMYGVLVVEAPGGCLAFLAAHSGLLGGRNDWPFFVPPVFDAQQPDGHFKIKEREISGMNRRIAELLQRPQLFEARQRLEQVRQQTDRVIAREREEVKARKARRDTMRREQPQMDDATKAMLIRESQHDKAQLRRLMKRCEASVAEHKEALDILESEIEALKRERREGSDALQRWLFDQYVMLNAKGMRRTLIDIFARFNGTLPPAGAGDCCAPKLLQFAYAHNLRPVSLAEFWLGAPPPTEVRRHLQFYPPCRSKCYPILQFMLQGLDAPLPGAEEVYPLREEGGVTTNDEKGSLDDKASIGTNEAHADKASCDDNGFLDAQGHIYKKCGASLHIIYEDEQMAVVSKPSGMLSVPGKSCRLSVESIVREHYGIAADVPVIVHRLDMDTSGLLLIARTREAHKALQQQFLDHTVSKSYLALLEGVPHEGLTGEHVVWHSSHTGTITLPLRPDLDDRPRQLVDFVHGKPAVTRFHLLKVIDGHQLIALTPVTGRTHQLRMHCAHHLGLNCPILGDPLYGNAIEPSANIAQRLYLHAEQITFRHPSSGKIVPIVSIVFKNT